jgi:hypothetical protein
MSLVERDHLRRQLQLSGRQFTVRKRFDRGLFFRANYTFGKSVDTASGLNYGGNGGYQGAQDSLNLNSER